METTRLIEEYLEGSLSEAERREVEKRADRDIAFRKLIELHREVNESIHDENLYDLHKKINTLLKGQKGTVSWRSHFIPVFRIAALFILITGSVVVLTMMLTRNREERIFSKYYKAYEADIITRANDAADKLSHAVLFYNQKKYKEAYSLFVQLTTSDNGNYIAWFFRGVTSMQMNDFDDALESFSEIPENWNNPYNEHRKWYQALVFLHEQKTVQARLQFEKISIEKGFYSQQSDEILSSLRR